MIVDLFDKELKQGDKICYYDAGYNRIIKGSIRKITPRLVIAAPEIYKDQPWGGEAYIQHNKASSKIIKL